MKRILKGGSASGNQSGASAGVTRTGGNQIGPSAVPSDKTKSKKLVRLAKTLKKLHGMYTEKNGNETQQEFDDNKKQLLDLSKKIMDASALADEKSVTTSAKTLRDNLKPTNTEVQDEKAMKLIKLLFKSKTQNEAIITKFGGKNMTIKSINDALINFTSVHTINSKKTTIYNYDKFESDAQNTLKLSTLDILKLISLLHYKDVDVVKTTAYDAIDGTPEKTDIGIFGYLTLNDNVIELIDTKSKDIKSELAPSRMGENTAYPEKAKRKKLPLIGIMYDIFERIYTSQNINDFIEWAENIEYSSYSTFFNDSSDPPNNEANYNKYLEKIKSIMNIDTFQTILDGMKVKVPETSAPVAPVPESPVLVTKTPTQSRSIFGSTSKSSRITPESPSSEEADRDEATEVVSGDQSTEVVSGDQEPKGASGGGGKWGGAGGDREKRAAILETQTETLKSTAQKPSGTFAKLGSLIGNPPKSRL